MISTLKPTAGDVIAIIKVNHTPENPVAHAQEENVIDFLYTFIGALNDAMLSAFLRFVTGMDITPEELNVNFNGGLPSNMMYPQAATCGSTLILSRYYTTYETFAGPFNNLLMDEKQWNTFTIL